MSVQKPFPLTEEEYEELVDSYSGICTECGEIHHCYTEPDAEGYHCDECGKNAVMGIENALICGVVILIGDAE